MRTARIAAACLFFAACSSELPHEAPFDPNAPLDKQAKASLSGTIRLEGETDFSQVTLDLQNESRTYNVDTAADGAVSLTGIVPGEYTLKIRTRYFEPVTETLTVEMGESIELGTRVLPPLKARVLGLATSEGIQGTTLVTTGGVNVTLKKTASVRVAVASAPKFRAMAEAATGATLRTVSGLDGGYEFGEVPAGGYTLYAATSEAGERAVGEVTVTGEGDVTVDPIVLRPLTGYFEILGSANGVPSSTYTSEAVVNLQLQQSSAVQVKVAVSTDGTITSCDLTNATPEALPSDTLRPLTFTSEGKKLVCVSYIDADGKETAPIYGTITYDATPPTLPSVGINGGAQVVSSNLVTLSLSAVDVHSGVAVHKVHGVNDFSAVSPKPFQPTDVYPLGATQGVQYVWVTFGDHAGNYSAPVSASVVLDSADPVPGGVPAVTKLDGTPLTSGATIAESRIKLTSSVSDSTALEMQITTDGVLIGKPWVPYEPGKIIDLPSGPATVSVRVRDAAGHVLTLLTNFIVTTDTTPPAGTLVIAPTAVTDPAITVQATGDADAIAVELAFDPGFVTSLGNFVPGPIAVTLPAGDGTKTVYGRFFDAAGNMSALVGDTVVLDTTPPQILSYAIAQASPTKDNPVTVQFGASGAAELRITEGADCGGIREPIGAGTKSFTVSSSEGNKEIRLQFFDAAGNASECAVRNVYYDPNPPVVGTLQINYGQAATSSNVVTLTFPGVSGATEVMVSEDPAYAGADWQSFSATKTFTLSAGNGVKTVYAKVADDAGHVVALTPQTITLDTTPPTAPSIFAAYDVTTQTSVLLTLSAGLVSDMWLSQDDPAFSTGGWETYTGSKVFSLTGTDGTKTIYAKFKKSTGLETGVVSETVILDRVAPTLPSVQINGGAAVVTSNIVTLSLSAVDVHSGVTVHKVNEVNDFSAVSPKSYQPTDVFSLTPGDGLKTVWVVFGDKAGNYSVPASATVVLDTTAPAVGGAVTLTKLDGTPLDTGDLLNESRVVLTSTVSDASALQMQITTNGSYAGVAWVPYEPNKVIDLTSGSPSISARVRDGAGLITDLVAAFTLTVDTTPPALTFARSSLATTNDPVIALSISSSEPGEAQVSEDPAFGGAAWFAVAATSFTLPAGDGLRTIYARTRDAAGNLSVTKQVAVQLDTAAPTGVGVAINGGAGYTKVAGVTLTLSGSGATQMQVSENPAFAGAAWTAFTTSYAHTITGGEGPVTVYARLRDEAGNVSGAASTSIEFDAQPPTGASIAIAEQPKTRQSYVTLALSAVGATELMLADDASFAGRPWQPVTATTIWTLAPGDGTKRVYVKYRDAAGNESAAVSASTILDMTPPVAGSLMLNGGAAITNSTTVAYAIAATDALAEPLEMQVSGEPGFGDAVWAPYAATGNKAIAAGDGVRSLYVRFRDAVGNVSLASSGSFILDQTGPQIASFVVNEGRMYATSSVFVDFQVGNWAAGDMVQVATAANFSGAAEYPSNAGVNRVTYTLTGLDGAKTVYARAKDTLGNFGPAWSTAVTLDTEPPAVTGPKAMVLASDDDYTTTRFVNLDLNVSGATEMLLWNSGQLLYATWEPFQASTVWALPFGDGVHTVQARFRDAARNVIQGYSDVITLDTGAPTSPSVAINAGGAYILSENVTLSLSAVGATGMQLSGDGVFDTEPITAYDTVANWTFTADEGQKTVYARFCDAAGNCSQIVSASALLDKTLPTGAIAVNQGAARTNASTVTLNLTAGDAVSGLQGIKLANSSAALATTDVVTYEATKIWTLAAPTGAGVEATKEVWLQVVDRAGHGSTPAKDEIVFDSLAPTGGITLASAVTNDTLIGVDLTYVPDVTHYKLSAGNSCAGGNWVEAAAQTVFTLPSIDGTHDVSVRFRDGVSNESTCYSANVMLDKVGPLPSIFLLTGSGTPLTGYSDSADVTVDFGTAEACTRAEIAEDVGFSVVLQTEPVCSGSVPYTFANTADGFKSLYLRFVDALGNAGPVTSQTIVVDSSVPAVGVAGGFTIAEGAYVRSAAVTLQMQAVGATRMRVAQAAACSGTLETYASTRPFTLSGLDGQKTLSVRFEDEAGNFTACYSRQVTLDSAISATWTVGLTGADGRTGTTSSQVLTVALTGLNLSDVVEMRTSNLASFADAQWVPVQTSFTWVVPCCDGLKTVYVEVRDRAGNTSLKTASITLDVTPPDSPVLQIADIDGDGFAVTAATIELTWTLPAGTSTFELQRQVIGQDVNFVTIEPALAGAQNTYTDSFAENGHLRRYRMRAVDAVGNASAWSGTAEDTPFSDGGNLFWTMGTEQQIRYAFPPKPGAYSVLATYKYEQADGTLISDVVAAGSSEFSMPWPATTRWNERLTVGTANQNNSLVYESTYDLGRNIKELTTTGGDTGIYPVLRTDRFGRVHAIYFEGWDSNLYYALRENGVWRTEQVTPNGSTINYAYTYPAYNLAIDANGEPMVAAYFFDGVTRETHLYTKSGATWNSQTIDATGRFASGSRGDMLIDRNGKAHLFYVDVIGSSLNVRYLTNASGSWVGSDLWTAAVGAGINEVRATQDALGKLHLAFKQGTPAAVYYGTNGSGSWAFSVAQQPGYNVGNALSISVSSTGANIYIAHNDETSFDMLLSSKVGAGAWSTQIVETAGTRERVEVFVDELGNAHLVTHDSHNIFYYTNTTGTFVKTTLITDNNLWLADMWASYDRSGRVHMGIWDTTARGMWYFRYSAPPLFQFDIPQVTCGVLGAQSAAFDNQGVLHVIDECTGLRHYSGYDPYWTETSSFDTANVHNKMALQVDANGLEHVVARRASDRRLVYRKQTGPAAYTDYIVVADAGTDDIGLALNPAGLARVLYKDGLTNVLSMRAFNGAAFGTALAVTTDAAGDVSFDAAIAVDAASTSWVAYLWRLADGSEQLRLAEISPLGVLVATQTLYAPPNDPLKDADDLWLGDVQIRVDAKGHKHILFNQSSNSYEIMHLSDETGIWKATRVRGGLFSLYNMSFVIDPWDNLRIGYTGETYTDTYLESRFGGQWGRVRLSTEAQTNLSLAFDPFTGDAQMIGDSFSGRLYRNGAGTIKAGQTGMVQAY